MKARTMRTIDWYVGVPVCYLLALYEMVRSLFPRRRGEVRNILFIKFFGLGSIVLSTPAVAAAREHYPRATIHYLTFAGNREALELLRCADRAHYIETGSATAFVVSTLRAIAHLRRAKIDLVFDLEFFAKFPLIVATLIGASRKAGFYLTFEYWRRRLLQDLGYYNHYWHVKDIFLSLVYLVGEADPQYTRFAQYCTRYPLQPIVPEKLTLVGTEKKLAQNGWKVGSRLILLNPNAGKELAPELKRWRDERWETLTGELLKRYPDTLIVYTGVASEATYVENIIAQMQKEVRVHVRNAAGQFSLRELHALLSLAQLFITIDSGPMHLATLTPTPLIALFFAETPVLYGPLSTHARVIYPALYGLPSFTVYTGKDPIVLKKSTIAESVSVEEVMSAAIQLMDSNG